MAGWVLTTCCKRSGLIPGEILSVDLQMVEAGKLRLLCHGSAPFGFGQNHLPARGKPKVAKGTSPLEGIWSDFP